MEDKNERSSLIQTKKWMREHAIEKIYGDYSGSGDSGCIDYIGYYPPQDGLVMPVGVENEVSEWFYKLANPNFNDDGSSGTFAITWANAQRRKLTMHVNHRDYFTSSHDSTLNDTY